MAKKRLFILKTFLVFISLLTDQANNHTLLKTEKNPVSLNASNNTEFSIIHIFGGKTDSHSNKVNYISWI